MTDAAFDYAIVGAGSAGCVLAERLSRDPNTRVILLEVGPEDRHPLIRMPRGIGKLLVPGNPHIFDYRVAPAEGRAEELWVKGRVIGGSSSINGQMYVRGAPADYDAWSAQGCQGWGWSEIGPRFASLEDHELGASHLRGVGGALKISMQPPGQPLWEALIQAAAGLGVQRVDDINDIPTVTQGGFGYLPRTTFKGERWSASKAFLKGARHRPGLTVAADTQVRRIEFENRRASRLRVRDRHGDRTIAVKREIILAAGAIESPKLLQLSGVGPAALLRRHAIDVVADRANVGRNLREHRYIPMQVRVKHGSLNAAFGGLGLAGSMLRYLANRSGPLSHSAHEVGGFIKTEPQLDRPDAQIGCGLYTLKGDYGSMTIDDKPGFTVGGYFMRPRSEGEVTIRGDDVDTPPAIVANYLRDDEDRRRSIALFRWLRRYVAQPALAPYVVEELTPGSQVQSDDEVVEAIFRNGNTAYHVCGTCRMGSDADSVVDPRLRVRGVEGLRVVDTSIMPSLVSGNTNAPAMVIGLRGAEFILEDANQEKPL